LNINIKKIHKNALMPTYGTDGAAAFDLYAAESMSIWAGESTIVDTGLAFEIPQGYVMRVYSRSGHGFKKGVRLVNCVGVIDSDYRGVLMIGIKNEGMFCFKVEQGDRIAQAIIEPIQRMSFAFCDELSETERGPGGFGSTGL
jgi:dUTP pyrophosphatase